MYNDTPIGKIKPKLFDAAKIDNLAAIKKLLRHGQNNEIILDEDTAQSFIIFCMHEESYKTIDWLFNQGYHFPEAWGLIGSLLSRYEHSTKLERSRMMQSIETIIIKEQLDLQSGQWANLIPVLDHVELLNMFLRLGANPDGKIEINNKYVENPTIEKFLEAFIITGSETNAQCLLALRAHRAIIEEKKSLEETLTVSPPSELSVNAMVKKI